jgi:antitoxin HicB
MRYAYPVRLDPEPDGSAVNVSFPDVPEALTWGDDGVEALILAEDCATGALRGYIKRGWPVPRPSPSRGRPTVTLPPLVAAKLALYEAMHTQAVSGEDLAARLGIAEPAVRRLLDLDHRSHIDQVEAALRCLGKRLEVTVRDAA